MTWKCAICGETDGVNGGIVNAVCHHCGRLLCRRHQIIIRDPAFSRDKGFRASAVHCPNCKNRHRSLAGGTPERDRP
jgi:hypothetical protein